MAYVVPRNVECMTHKFKDHDFEKRALIRRIQRDMDLITRMSNNIQTRANVINHLVMINDWYLQENAISIQKGGDDTDSVHLTELADFFNRYGGLLVEIDKIMYNTLELVSNNFDYEDEDIQDTINRVKRCQ